MFENVKIESPKQTHNDRTGRAGWYPYYAGFPLRFATKLLASLELGSSAFVLDPWNGSGTTTDAAEQLGIPSIGTDLNPAMVMVGKGRSLCCREFASLMPLAEDILAKSRRNKGAALKQDPLAIWCAPRSGLKIRELEFSVRELLVECNGPLAELGGDELSDLSDLACFFYIALFRMVRRLFQPFYASNPTWLKQPQSHYRRVRPSNALIESTFIEEVESMLSCVWMTSKNVSETSVNIRLGSSMKLETASDKVDVVISSPPYCTRIDYAVATMAELALMGYRPKTTFDELRRQLLGTATVCCDAPTPSQDWGETCNRFLNALKRHSSKASRSYYFKNHVQYFGGLADSISEIARVLRTGGGAVLVVQDSYYKELHNDLPTMVVEMAQYAGLALSRRQDFVQERSMASVNPGARRHGGKKRPVESVLCFSKRRGKA